MHPLVLVLVDFLQTILAPNFIPTRTHISFYNLCDTTWLSARTVLIAGPRRLCPDVLPDTHDSEQRLGAVILHTESDSLSVVESKANSCGVKVDSKAS